MLEKLNAAALQKAAAQEHQQQEDQHNGTDTDAAVVALPLPGLAQSGTDTVDNGTLDSDGICPPLQLDMIDSATVTVMTPTTPSSLELADSRAIDDGGDRDSSVTWDNVVGLDGGNELLQISDPTHSNSSTCHNVAASLHHSDYSEDYFIEPALQAPVHAARCWWRVLERRKLDSRALQHGETLLHLVLIGQQWNKSLTLRFILSQGETK